MIPAPPKVGLLELEPVPVDEVPPGVVLPVDPVVPEPSVPVGLPELSVGPDPPAGGD
jgi:hypothetical protein